MLAPAIISALPYVPLPQRFIDRTQNVSVRYLLH